MQNWAIILFALTAGLAMFHAWQAHALRRVVRQYAGAKIANKAPAAVTGAKGRRTEATIVFTDMRGFTTIAEGLKPERVALLLNTVLTPALAIIREQGGIVDKIQGDAIFYRHADAETALGLLSKVHETLEQAGGEAGRKIGCNAPKFCSGVHSGPVYLGFIGATGGYIDYTIIGDAVNTSARLQGLTAKYNVPILISGETFRLAGKPAAYRLLDIVQVKGRTSPIEIYTKPLDLGIWAGFEYARAMYTKGEFAKAEAAFKLINLPLWEARCTLLKKNPPATWTGVWNWAAK